MKSMELLTNHMKSMILVTVVYMIMFTETSKTYLFVVNTFKLTDNVATFTVTNGFIMSLSAIPASFTYEAIMKIKPRIILSILLMIQGLSALLYGITISLSDVLSESTRLYVGILFGVPIGIISNMADAYIQRHLIIEISERYSVALGTLNSYMHLLGTLLRTIFVLLIGYIYNYFSIEHSNIIIGVISLALNSGIAILSFYLLAGYKPITDKNVAVKPNIWRSIGSQCDRFKASKLFKVIIANIFENCQITPSYIFLFLLSSGLSALQLSYVESILYVTYVLGCLFNMFKGRLHLGDRYIQIWLIGQIFYLLISFYICTAYIIVAWLPWLRADHIMAGSEVNFTEAMLGAGDVEFSEATSTPTWTIMYVIAAAMYTGYNCFTKLVVDEFYQRNIPKYLVYINH